MNLLAFDGFESDKTQKSFLRRYPGSTNIPSTFPSQGGRLGGQALRHDGDGITPLINIVHDPIASDEYVFGCGLYLENISAQLNWINVIKSGLDVFQLSLFGSGGGFGIAAKRYDAGGANPVTEFQSAEHYFDFRVWHYIEVRAPLRGGVSGVIIRVNGNTLVSNYDSRPEVGAGFDTTEIKLSAPVGDYIAIDDMYMAYGEESKLLGPGAQITSLYPKLDSTAGWISPQHPNAHYAAVDDAAVGDVDDQTTYVEGVYSGTRDTYYFKEPVGVRSNILGVQLHTDLRSTGTEALQVEPVLNNTVVSRMLAPLAYTRKMVPYTLDPASGDPWTIESLDEIIAGLKIPGDEVPEGSVLNIYLKDGSEVFTELDEENDLIVIAKNGDTLQILDETGQGYIPITLKGGGEGELKFDTSVTSASWAPWGEGGNQAVFNAHFRGDGGFYEAPDGVSQSVTIQSDWDIPIEFSGTSDGGGNIEIIVLPDSTATQSLHYNVIGGLSRSIGPGDSSHTVEIQPLTTNWHKARIAKFWLDSSSSNILLTGQKEWHLWVYPQQDPPTLEFAASSVVVSGPGLYNITINQAGLSMEDTKIYLRFQGTNGTNWVEGVHYSYSVPDIAAGQLSTVLALTIIDDIFDPEDLVVYLDHEPSDGSQKTFWQFTEDWDPEGVVDPTTDTIVTVDGRNLYPYSGEHGTHAWGGGGNDDTPEVKRIGWYNRIQSNPLLNIPAGQIIYKPNGEEMEAILSPPWLKSDVSDWYTRESFFLEQWSGGLGRKQVYDSYILLSTYVHPIYEGPEHPFTNSHFFNINVRNRAPGDMEMGCAFHRQLVGSPNAGETTTGSRDEVMSFWHNGTLETTPITFAGSLWYPWNRENLSPTSEIGMEIEIDPATGQTYMRLWCLVHVDNTNWILTNTGGDFTVGGLDNGSVSSTGTTTQLIDSSKDFGGLRVGYGDVVFNKTDGCEAYVIDSPFSSGDTINLSTPQNGKNNQFQAGDSYYLARNYRTTVNTVTEYGFPETGSVQGVKVVVNKFGSLDIEVDGVGKGDQIENFASGREGILNINFDTDHITVYGEEGIGEDYFYMKGVTLSDIVALDLITIMHQSCSPLDDGTWSGNAIFRYNAVQIGDTKNSKPTSKTLSGGTAKEKGCLAWAPQYYTAGTRAELLRGNKPDAFYGPEDAADVEISRYWERRGAWWEPRGNATRLSGGNRSCTFDL